MRNRSDQEPLVIRSPEEAVSAVPYMLGFHPEDSLVVLGYGGPYGACALRIDLPRSAAGAAEVAGHAAGMLTANEFPAALLVGYGRHDDVAPLLTAARAAMAGHDIEVREVLRVERGRWWSYTCSGPECCPADGAPFDIRTTVVAAQATVAGQVVLADRAELARTVAPLGGAARGSLQQATRRAETRLYRRAADEPDPAGLRDRMIEEGLPLVRRLLERVADLPAGEPTARLTELLGDDEVAWLGLLLTHVRVRDEAWVRIDPDHAEVHVGLWRHVMRRVERRYVPAPACLLAYAAFMAGDGGLANVALDRAVDADPDYSMALLLRDLMQLGVPPDKARLRMSPESLAEAWEGRFAADAEGPP
ncbi:DUF4192 domain-containing protein [Actinomadura scrupuli]|uniref:DUF4192 domain-containing protein n=1 Tax=Actinomadura scrupuli TaxID=559629 RepID=UPI003D985FB3